MKLEERIRAVREIRGWSQGDLARKLDVAPTTIAGWETGRRQVKLGEVPRICESLGIKPEYLFIESLWTELQMRLEEAEQLKRDALAEAERLLFGAKQGASDSASVSPVEHDRVVLSPAALPLTTPHRVAVLAR